MTAISFLHRALLTANKTGLVKQWVRPLAIKSRPKHRERGNSFAEVQDMIGI